MYGNAIPLRLKQIKLFEYLGFAYNINTMPPERIAALMKDEHLVIMCYSKGRNGINGLVYKSEKTNKLYIQYGYTI